ncbi:Hypothetical predicted protein [Octopus vulgaris]|uniref:Uncharacterized protein n=1 Tax=Octopus vulgaris TaxID=6645 RepID=A0AA36B1E9_OCTVU|nr:Hypothetical predicted protein [Octopus vulgaris]
MKLSNQSTAQHIKSRSTLRSSDGQALLTDIASILNRWSEYFQALFSAVRVVQEKAILHIQQQPVSMELDEPPALEETRLAIGWLKSRKTAGVDDIPSEINEPARTSLPEWRPPQQGAQKERYKDCLKQPLSVCDIDYREWSTLTADRVAWRRTISDTASFFEIFHITSLEDKSQRRKNNTAASSDPGQL